MAEIDLRAVEQHNGGDSGRDPGSCPRVSGVTTHATVSNRAGVYRSLMKATTGIRSLSTLTSLSMVNFLKVVP